MDRRLFMQATGAAALSAIGPGRANDAIVTLPTAHVEPMPAVAIASAFNDGRSQVNLNFLQTGGDFPLLNCLEP